VFTACKLRQIVLAGILCIAPVVRGDIAIAQLNTVGARVELKKAGSASTDKKSPAAANLSDIVVWLKPLDRAATTPAATEQSRKRLQLVQKNKAFQPHLLVVPVGSSVEFPNRDPFFHNVFSLFDGKRFDLGLYEAGASNSVRFDRVGVSFLFCNIHPEMSAVVVAVDTPFYSTADRAGNIAIPNVPDGKYELHVWYERSLPEDLKPLTKIVTVSSTSKDLGTISIPENPSVSSGHKNKYGQDYTPPPTPGYSHP
jgi:plastocyanin